MPCLTTKSLKMQNHHSLLSKMTVLSIRNSYLKLKSLIMRMRSTLGISHWGRYLNHSGPYVHTDKVNDEIVRVYNMLATHAIMYISESYVDICKRIAYHYGYEVEGHIDIGFAEIHKLYNVYSFDEPLLRQYDWNAVTTGRLSEVSLDKTKGESLFQKILAADENYYKLNQEFKSPIKPLIEMRDVSGIPGYYIPTRIV